MKKLLVNEKVTFEKIFSTFEQGRENFDKYHEMTDGIAEIVLLFNLDNQIIGG